MLITKPFLNAAHPHDTHHPVVIAINIEESNIKIFMHGVGAALQLQYFGIVQSRHWRDLGLGEEYLKDRKAFSDDPSYEVDGDHFVLKVKGNDIQTVLNALQKIAVIDEKHKQACNLELSQLKMP